MSAGLDFASIRRSSAVEVISAVPPQSFNPTAMSRLEGRPVICSPEQLRLHRALEELGWTGVIDEFNDAARLKEQSVPEPILITTNRTILAGFGRWRSAVFDGRHPESDVRSAVGRHARTTAGLVPAAISGTRSTREEYAQRAFTNGLQPSASSVAVVAALGLVCAVITWKPAKLLAFCHEAQSTGQD